jgi:hypothetical protein
MLARNEEKGKLLFKDSERFSKLFRIEWGILLHPTLIVIGVFMTLIGFWLIPNSQSSLEKITVSYIVLFIGFAAAVMGILLMAAALDARPLAIYEKGLDIPIRPYRWMLKGRSHFIAFNDISKIERRTDEGREYYLISTKSGRLLGIHSVTVSDMDRVRRLLAESSDKVQYKEDND